MAVEVIRCPKCREDVRVPETLFGTRVRCPRCRAYFKAPIRDSDGALTGADLLPDPPVTPPPDAAGNPTMLLPGLGLLLVGLIGLLLNGFVVWRTVFQSEAVAADLRNALLDANSPVAKLVGDRVKPEDITPEMVQQGGSFVTVFVVQNLLIVLSAVALFARRFYSKTVARLSVLFLLTAQHLVLSNNDVRAEPYLVGLLAGSLYHWARASEARFAHHLLLGALWSGCAVMTKGPFVLIPMGAGLAVHWIKTKQWRELLRARWWVGLALVGVFILPELYCLYVQFDLHPEKEVFGRTGVSGVRFFFWDSQFGRFLNTGPIRGKGDPSFFVHTALWAFVPWSLWLTAAVASPLLRKRSAPSTGREYYTWGASGVTFLIFSLSSFQLPHYLIILFPFFAVITADWVARLASDRSQRIAAGVQLAVAALVVLAAAALLWLSQSSRMALGIVLLAAAVGVIALCIRRVGGGVTRAVVASFGAAAVLNAVLNLFFCPEVLRYQAGSEAAAVVNRLPPRSVGLYAMNSNSFELYAEERVARWDARGVVDAAKADPVYVLLPADAVSELERSELTVRPVKIFDQFPVTRLIPRFLLPSRRATAVRKVILAEVKAANPEFRHLAPR